MSPSDYTSILGSIGLILLGLALSQFITRNRLPLPPGPVPKFILGNVHQLPKSENWKTYAEWSKIYGKWNMHPQSTAFDLVFPIRPSCLFHGPWPKFHHFELSQISCRFV